MAGEITTIAYVHLPDIVRATIDDIGYTDPATASTPRRAR